MYWPAQGWYLAITVTVSFSSRKTTSCVIRSEYATKSQLWGKGYLIATGLVRFDTPSGPCEDLEVNQMNMDWVAPSTGFIDQLPNFGCSSFWLRENTVCGICKPEPVDSPFSIGAFKPEASVDLACVCRKVEIYEGRGNDTIS